MRRSQEVHAPHFNTSRNPLRRNMQSTEIWRAIHWISNGKQVAADAEHKAAPGPPRTNKRREEARFHVILLILHGEAKRMPAAILHHPDVMKPWPSTGFGCKSRRE